jgi:acyl transferase domain-containing protein/SAM-dependent methyltransferase
MSQEHQPAQGADALSPVKRALLEIRELRARVAELESAAREPIAIIGIGIRTPGGVRSMDDLAGLLWSGADAITPVPADRWPVDAWYDADQDAPGKMYSREGGFLDEVDRFDAGFFGIAPVEAASMDPQQRLVLELAWEALENAGHAPADLAGRSAGVYLGIANGDYGRALFAHPELIDPYFSSGNAFSVASGRIAYLLGLQGPAVSIDTACSSSLVAVHLACQALRSGECELALAGGVNLILSPEINVNFCKAGMMSRDGRCKTFDASADGYVRGEGGAVIVLRRLRDAEAGGDRVLAVIRGSAINQDGRSNGLTAPNGPAQEAVIRAALAAAAVQPADIDYVEAHGTGTPLGDPIEVNALGAVLAEGRARERPVLLGSIKTNMGHLEAAAGIVGLAKALLVLQRREVPPHLHLAQPNPYIDWASLPVAVPSGTQPLRAGGAPLLAAVSSFGFSGTNAHVVLQEAPAPAAASKPAAPLRLLAISARDPQALDALAARYIEILDARRPAAAELADLCSTASAGRAQFALRASVVGESAAELATALATFRRGEEAAGLVAGAATTPPRVAFLFPGQGPQYLGMGRELHAAEPVFRETFDACAAVLDELLPAPLATVLFGGDAAVLDQTLFAQPAMFAIEVSLAALWRSWGIEPVAVMGHSFGEYAAACVAGVMSLQDGARMVAARGRLTQLLPAGGAMAVLEAGQQDVAAAIAAIARADVSIAALNGAANTVVSGAREVVQQLVAQFAARGAKTKVLRVSQAFHSPLVEPVLDAFEREVDALSFAAPRITLISSLLGQVAGADTLRTARYWREHLRQPVRFDDGMRSLAALGITHYIEMSPHPVLLGMGAEITAATWLPSLREGQAPWPVIYDSLQQLWCQGATVAWRHVQQAGARRRVPLPTYPFNRRRCWVDAIGEARSVPRQDRWAALSAAMERQAERGPLDLDAASYPAKWECLARLTRAHAIDVLRGAGLFISAGERHSLDEVMRRAGIAATYHHLIGRWLGGLAAHGLLRVEDGAFCADRPLPDAQLPRLWQEAALLLADNQPLLDYVRNCGQRVGAVLSGRESPLETLFPDGSFELATGLYQRSATMRYINALAGAAFEALAATTPAGGVLRVLEIGAGTGGTTASLLPLLSADRTRYLFTDVSELFLSQARERFSGYPFVDYALFDLDGPQQPADVPSGGFDVIVSANCVHAMKDLRAALARLCTLLAPGGVLVLVESTVHLEYFDMTTGLIEGWQHFADDLRTDNPLLPPATWTAALLQAGFAAARSWPGEGSVAGAMGQHVIVARAPGDARVAAQRSQPDAAYSTAEATAVAQPDEARQAWLQRYEAAYAEERFELVRELVRGEVRRVLRLDAGAVPPGQARLMDLGMDSLMAVQLRNGLTRALRSERPLPSTLMFDYPTIDAIAQFLVERLSAASAPEAAAGADASPAPAARLDAAALDGMSDADIEKLLEERLGSDT